jgi:dTDP-glucose 4,6-dehydratase
MVGQSWETPEDWYQTNVVSMAKLLSRIGNSAEIARFVQFSTPEVYGSTNGWIKENFNFAPNTPYAVSRAASDWHLKALHENFGFPVIFTRAANVYGEHQRLYRIVPRVILSALTGQKLPLQGGGKSIRSFIHIDDVSEALLKILENGIPGESYHISTNELVTIYQLVAIVAEKLGVQVEDLIEMAPDRPGKDFAYKLDSQKIRSQLGWSDQITLSDGIDRTIKWVQDNLDELKQMPLNYEHRR